MKKTACIRLRNLKRRSGYDANILPAKRPALSVADRVAKVDNVALLEMHLPWTHTTFVCLLVLGEGRGARVPEIFLLFTAANYSQVRQQEDDAQREDRLADQRHRQAVVRFVVVVVVVVNTRAMVTVIDN